MSELTCHLAAPSHLGSRPAKPPPRTPTPAVVLPSNPVVCSVDRRSHALILTHFLHSTSLSPPPSSALSPLALMHPSRTPLQRIPSPHLPPSLHKHRHFLSHAFPHALSTSTHKHSSSPSLMHSALTSTSNRPSPILPSFIPSLPSFLPSSIFHALCTP